MQQIAYQTVDVFTETLFGGNPLAVVVDGRGLSDKEMQQLAREFNYSETTFVLPPSDEANTARVRIFTPASEVPFAGHPNVGTAFVLARLGQVFGQPVGEQMRFEEQAGLVEVAVLRVDGVVRGAAITAPRALELGPEVSAELVAECVSLDVAEIQTAGHPPRIASVGLPFVVAELASRDALARAKPNPARFAEGAARYPHMHGDFALFLYVVEAPAPPKLSARMFAPLDGVLEDPATGSASAALGAYRAVLSGQRDGEQELLIAQGVDMGRPSTIRLHVRLAGGQAQQVVVAGECVPVMAGMIVL